MNSNLTNHHPPSSTDEKACNLEGVETDVFGAALYSTKVATKVLGADFCNWRNLLAAVMALSLVSGCKKEAPPPPPPPIVQVMEIKAANAPNSVEFIGQLDSPENVEVRARVEAFVDKMLFTEGTEVKEGDPLFKLDDKPYMERLAAANGSLAEAKAALNKYQQD